MTKDMLIVKSAVTMDTSGNSESTTLMDLEPLVLYLRSRTGSEWDSFNATPEVQSITNHSSVDDFGSSCMCDDTSELDFGAYAKSTTSSAFWIFRFNFLFVTLVVMLADGLQGTHLYVLYDSYGFSVASLYSLGFFAGAISAPILGPMIDRFGRKKAALVYCGLEMWINQLEQYPFLTGLVFSRVVGGITTNLLNIVFEAWVDTEARINSLPKEQYEILMRDAVIVSNLAAIGSGFLSHYLAETLGAVGPFEGAVTCTGIAFVVIFFLWNDNYGKIGEEDKMINLSDTVDTFRFIKSDTRILRICIIQGLTLGALHIFIFLWSPLLADFAKGASAAGRIHWWGMDSNHAPAYGLIFGAYMTAGVVGGLCSSTFRKLLTAVLSPAPQEVVPTEVACNEEGDARPMDAELHCSLCYFVCSALLLLPCFMSDSNEYSFSLSLALFVLYEFIVGIYSPCEGMIRSIYIPAECRGSVMAIPTIIVNVAVALAVASTEKVSKQTSLALVSIMLTTAGGLQLSLLKVGDWSCILERTSNCIFHFKHPMRMIWGMVDETILHTASWDVSSVSGNPICEQKSKSD